MTKTIGEKVQGVILTTALTIAAGASETAELQVSGFLPLVAHIGSGWVAANLGVKARPAGSNTSRVVYEDTGSAAPYQISGINTTIGGAYLFPASPGLHGFNFVKFYKKSTTAATTSSVKQTSTAGAVKIWIEGLG